MRDAEAYRTETPATERKVLRFGLASRVLLLTIAFVMLAEVAVYVPSIANYRNNWLRDRLSAAYTAALVLEAAPDSMVPDELKTELLSSVGTQSIAIKRGEICRAGYSLEDLPRSALHTYLQFGEICRLHQLCLFTGGWLAMSAWTRL